MIPWYVIYRQDWDWYASSKSFDEARDWLSELKAKGYTKASMEVVLAPSE